MNILIKETGELRSLSFIDWHDGQKYTEQLISASGEDCNFLFDQDGEVFMTDAPTFSKWNAFFRSHCDVDSACSALGLKPISKAEYDPFVHLYNLYRLSLKVGLRPNLFCSQNW